jgi:hypothetical protein
VTPWVASMVWSAWRLTGVVLKVLESGINFALEMGYNLGMVASGSCKAFRANRFRRANPCLDSIPVVILSELGNIPSIQVSLNEWRLGFGE